MVDELRARLARLEDEFAAARAQWDEERAALRGEVERLQAEVARLEAENRGLREKLGEVERKGARQAAPFRRREKAKIPLAQQKKPGRPPGHPGAHRQIPSQIDAEVEVPLSGCPDCGGAVHDVQRREQYVEEIPPVRPIVTRVITYVGHCVHCGQVRSTHPLQTSTAGGAAQVQLGPRALAWGTELNKRLGISMRKTCGIFQKLLGLRLTAGGLSQALDRIAARCRNDYQALQERIRNSSAVYADETSWWVGEPGWWLWVYTTPQDTLYRVEESRGQVIVHETLGSAFPGVLVSDCCNAYDQIAVPKQKCVAHHLQALRQARSEQDECHHFYLDEWQTFFLGLLTLWKERSVIPAEELAARRQALERQCDELLQRELRWPGDKKLRNRVLKRRGALFTCLEHADVEPTNNRAERALRPAVISRKISCGNKTRRGKQTWEILASLAATCHQRAESFVDFLTPRVSLSRSAA
jgi:hypothetical protein